MQTFGPWVGCALVLGIFAGCGGQEPAPQAPGAAANAAPAEATATAESSAAEPAPEPAEAPAPSAAPAPAASSARAPVPAPLPISRVCEQMCDAQANKCSADKVEACKQNYCSRYGSAPDVCEQAVRLALACTEQHPEFSVCANVISESCAKPFRAAEQCIATGVAPVAAEAPKELPDGWKRYEALDAGFSVGLPPGVESKSERGVKTWTAKSGGTTYEITLGPPPPVKKFDQKAFVRIASKLLGKCAPKMKLFAMVEKPDSTLIHFRTVCPDKTQERGEFFVQGNDYFVLRATWGEGPNPDTDQFAYSFVRKK